MDYKSIKDEKLNTCNRRKIDEALKQLEQTLIFLKQHGVEKHDMQRFGLGETIEIEVFDKKGNLKEKRIVENGK
jgi:hypothetical protein